VFLLNLLFNHWTAFRDPHPGAVTEALEAGAVAPGLSEQEAAGTGAGADVPAPETARPGE
jgi:hypothetical protein